MDAQLKHTIDKISEGGSEAVEEAVKKYGYYDQSLMVVEECAELIDAIMKLGRSRTDAEHVCEEVADVQIMLWQMMEIYGAQNVNKWISMKLDRLKIRMGGEK